MAETLAATASTAAAASTATTAAPTVSGERQRGRLLERLPPWAEALLQPITTAFVIAAVVMVWALVLRPDTQVANSARAEAFATPAPPATPALSYEWQHPRADASFDTMYRSRH